MLIQFNDIKLLINSDINNDIDISIFRSSFRNFSGSDSGFCITDIAIPINNKCIMICMIHINLFVCRYIQHSVGKCKLWFCGKQREIHNN